LRRGVRFGDDRALTEVPMRTTVTMQPLALALMLALAAAPAGVARAEETPAGQQAAEETAKELAERLQRELNEAQTKAYEEYKAAVEEAQREAEESGGELVMPSFDMRAAITPFIPRFEAAAKRFAGTDDAVQFLSFLVFYAQGEDAGDEALETLLTKHLEHASIGEFAGSLRYLTDRVGAERVRSTLDTIVERNPDTDARAQALVARGEILRDTDRDAARADFVAAAETAQDAKVAARARGVLTEMDKLGIGMVAPEIEGQDLDGVAFKLSDYRGKVVLLDFWGDW
jgi:hypothetical protein